MKKIEILWIRACKSREPLKRVYRLYRRFYCKAEQPAPEISIILGLICEQYSPIRPTSIAIELSPGRQWKYATENYWEQAVQVFMNHLRHTDVHKLEGYVKPKRFKELT